MFHVLPYKKNIQIVILFMRWGYFFFMLQNIFRGFPYLCDNNDGRLDKDNHCLLLNIKHNENIVILKKWMHFLTSILREWVLEFANCLFVLTSHCFLPTNMSRDMQRTLCKKYLSQAIFAKNLNVTKAQHFSGAKNKWLVHVILT